MKKAIKITIPEPCHEDWAKMTITEKGRHCKVCTKEVVDFTKQSDEAIFKHVTKNTNTCGRFSPKQLNRKIELDRKKRHSLLPYAASLLLPLSLMNTTNATTEAEAPKNYVSLGIGSRTANPSVRAQITTKGHVYDFNGNPLRNVKITSNETGATTWTAKDGSYTLITLDHEKLTFNHSESIEKIERTGSKSAVMNIFLEPLVWNVTTVVGDIISEEVIEITQTAIKGKIRNTEMPKEISEEIKEVVQDTLKAKTIKITGNVKDDAGIPLPGANVIIKGTSTGTQTDFDGNYTIEADPNQILTFSYVGFETKEITISNISNDIDVQLEVSLMGEMIVVLGGAISVCYIDGDEPQETDEERIERIRLQKAADKNTQKFKEIQQARKKTERKARRGEK